MAGMEAAVLSAAISGVLKIVSNKLALLLVKEYSSIVGVNKDLRKLHHQVVEINNWLENAGDKVTRNNSSSTWLEEWKDIAYAVDDVVDEFQLETEKDEVCGDGGIVYKCMYKKPKSIIFQYKAASKVKKIKKRLAEFVKQRTDFSSITNSLFASNSVLRTGKKIGAKLSLPNVDEASVLGREQEKHQIISKLIEANDQQKIKIVSVIGLGGSGKTTLAQLVFNDGNDIEKYFKVRRWVHVSQEFDVEELIKKLFEAISGEKSEHCPVQKMSEKISEELSEKRFMLVLDDVWTEDRFQWEEFMVHLKRGVPGSAILLTTRNRKVAEIVGSSDQFDLPFLSEDDSWELFQKSLVVPAKGLEVGFVEVGKEIVKKCGGLPLAIKALAGVLHGKERIEQWQAVRDNNLLDVEGQERRVSSCLRLSYLNLPSHLKQCFTICSLFPKGYKIYKEQLIDLWIAHDMITPVDDGVDYLEGYECFNSLLQMAFLQYVDKYNGRVRCTMHDLVHDLARSIMDDEISLDVPKQPASSTKNCRYFSLTERPRNYLPKNHFEKARAIYIDRGDDLIFGKALKNARHLRSIAVDFMWTKAVPIAIFQLNFLKYLNMSRLLCSALPEAISNVWRLQALHVPSSRIVSLPESIGRLQKLRTLNLSDCLSLESLPDSIGDCHMISSIDLRGCQNLRVLPNSIDRNKRLRVLRLCYTKIERLPSSITTLENLECLDLVCCHKLVELPEGFGNLKKLEVLNLEGCGSLRAMPVGIGQLTRLESMSLFVVGEGEKSARISELGNVGRTSRNLTIGGVENVTDPDDAYQACLKQKANLQTLDLRWKRSNNDLEQAVLDGLEPPSRIKCLEIWGYAGGQYARWMLKQAGGGAQEAPQFTCLTVMRLNNFPHLKHLEGLVELPCLEELELRHMRSLESISGGPFPLLVKLKMTRLDRLREVWMVTEERTLAGWEEGGGCSNHLERLQIGSRLSHLNIWQCPELIVKPYMPSSLEYLELYGSNEQLLSLCQGCSWSSSFQPSFSFSHLKELRPGNMTELSSASPPKLGSGHGGDLLQHMMALESLNIMDCDGLTELPESMRSLTSLRSLSIEGCLNLCTLPEWLGELRSLQAMNISKCNSLSSLPQSMGHLTSLQYLRIEECSKLRSLGELRSLQEMVIRSRCRLSSLPQSTCHLTSLQELRIERCDALHQLPEWLGELRSLREFWISHMRGLTCLPQSMCRLTSLEKLQIWQCDALHQLPECLGELRSLREFWIQGSRALTCLPQSMGHLTSLRKFVILDLPGLSCLPQSLCLLTSLEHLEINNCDAIHQLPECLGELRSLRELDIRRLPGLTRLPQSMCRLTSLEVLLIWSCAGIKSLPEWIKGLTALQILSINGCPDLERRCERGKGEDWHLISHIPYLGIW